MSDLEELIRKPFCRGVIAAFLKMLEKTPAAQRERPPSLNVNGKNSYFNELHHPTYVGAEIDAQNNLEACASLGLLEIKYKDKKRYLPISQRKVSILFNPEYEAQCRVILGMEVSRVAQEWVDAIENTTMDLETKNSLKKCKPIIIANRSTQEIVEKIAEYANKKRKDDFVRMASASMFWGLSKVLDSRPELWLSLHIIPSPVRINAWAPNKTTSKILFIENMQTFEAAQLNTELFGDYILVYSSGFAGTANRLNSESGRSIYFSVNGSKDKKHLETLNRCLDGEDHIESYFWGDLDYAGIDIFLSLKRLIPSVMLWEKGYLEMISLSSYSGHSPLQANKEGQNENKSTGITFIDEVLLPSIRKRGFFDQEGVLF